jgi:hypothetical protein
MLRTETVREDHITIESVKDINVGKPNGRSKMKRGSSVISRDIMFSENLKRKLAVVSASAPFSEYKIVRFWNCLNLMVCDPLQVNCLGNWKERESTGRLEKAGGYYAC